MVRSSLPIWLVLLAIGCAPHARSEAIHGPDWLARPTPGTSAQVMEAARGDLTQLSLPVEPPAPEAARIMSYPILLHGWWFPGPVSDRLLCGVPFSRVGLQSPLFPHPGYDLRNAVDLTQRLPIRIRVGFDVSDRLGGSSTRLIVQATGLRRSTLGDYDDQIACIPTRAFVDSVFEMLAAGVGSSAQ